MCVYVCVKLKWLVYYSHCFACVNTLTPVWKAILPWASSKRRSWGTNPWSWVFALMPMTPVYTAPSRSVLLSNSNTSKPYLSIRPSPASKMDTILRTGPIPQECKFEGTDYLPTPCSPVGTLDDFRSGGRKHHFDLGRPQAQSNHHKPIFYPEEAPALLLSCLAQIFISWQKLHSFSLGEKRSYWIPSPVSFIWK